jgi:transmembrane sensor
MGLPPVRLLVSHGAIEVVGTSFNVIQNDQRGQVNLQEGKIRFRSIKGTTVELEPGQSLDWPLPEPTDPQQASPEHIQAQQLEHRVAPVAVLDAGLHGSTPSIPGTVNAPGPAHPTVVERLEQIQGLRSRGQWARAAEELSSLLRGPLPGATRERLSYELGSIVTYQIHDATRACAIWREHQKTYPRGRYRAEVERAQRSLTCGD